MTTKPLVFRLRPSTLGAALLVAIGLSTAAASRAEGVAPTDVELERAERLWQQGRTAAARRDYEAARAAYREAFTIAPHRALLAGLGDAEVRTGHYVEGARALWRYLQDADGPPRARQMAEQSLTVALKHVAQITIRSEPEGALVQVDDETIAATPLDGPLFYTPGDHTIRLSKGGFAEAQYKVRVEAAETRTLHAILHPIPAVTTAAAPPNAAPPPSPEPPEPADSSWRMPVLVAGAAASLVTLGVAGGFWLDGQSQYDRRDELGRQLGSSPSSCYNPPAERVGLCQDFQETNDRIRRDTQIAMALGVTGVALGAVTAGVVLLWPRQASGPVSFRIAPGVARREVGFEISTSF